MKPPQKSQRCPIGRLPLGLVGEEGSILAGAQKQRPDTLRRLVDAMPVSSGHDRGSMASGPERPDAAWGDQRSPDAMD
jgi:hypothetical protein